MSQAREYSGESFEAEVLAAVMPACGIDTAHKPPVRQGGAVNHVLRQPARNGGLTGDELQHLAWLIDAQRQWRFFVIMLALQASLAPR